VSDAKYPCPDCGEHLSAAQRPRWVDDLQGGRRDRTCVNGHTYPTVERITPREFLRTTRVRAGQRTRTYSTDQLQSDLSLKLAPVLSKDTRNQVVGRVEMSIVRERNGRRAPKEIDASQISQTVVRVLKDFSGERQLSKRVADALRRAHVLFALSQGELEFTDTRRDPVLLGGDGFEALPGILEWLVDQYPRQAGQEVTRRLTPHYGGQIRVDAWHTLRGDAAPRPKTLLRRVVIEQRTAVVLGQNPSFELRSTQEKQEDWESFPFEEEVYLRSVRRAFAGRRDYEHLARYSTQWVLFALAGQEIVRVSDLVAMTTQCLRRVDAVASLRWAVIAKNLTPAGLVPEVQGMLEWPAPRLRFESGAAADMRITEQISPHRAAPPETPQATSPPSMGLREV